MTEYHVPVMLDECMTGLDIRPDGIYVDVTMGGGGHSRAILARLSPAGRLYGFDQDADAERNAPDDPRFTFVRSNFRFLKNFLRYHKVSGVDGVLADLGVSSHHLDDASRGFTFRTDAPLDMRMNTRAGFSAADLLATADEEKLAQVFSLYGELRQARRIASAIVRSRATQPLLTTGDLVRLLTPFVNKKAEKRELAQAFQALRIETNHEMQALETMLQQAVEVLKPGGRLVVLSYHSLEDRIVKNVIKTGNAEGRVDKDFFGRIHTPMRAVTSKVATASEEEVAANPRARSAKLRIAQRINEERNEKP